MNLKGGLFLFGEVLGMLKTSEKLHTQGEKDNRVFNENIVTFHYWLRYRKGLGYVSHFHFVIHC